MRGFDLTGLSADELPTGTWAAALLHALARDEATGRRPQRLTEPRLATWNRFRGRLTTSDLFALLFEDAAVLHRIPFDPFVIGGPIRMTALTESVANRWLDAIRILDLKASGSEYILEQAQLLALLTKMARSDLNVVKPHHKVLELPGTGGELAHHLVSSQGDVTLQDNFVVACASWQELTLAGIIALERVAPHSDFVQRIESDDLCDLNHPLRQRSFDFVIGLHPDKGGLFRAEDQLAIWFGNAKILLV